MSLFGDVLDFFGTAGDALASGIGSVAEVGGTVLETGGSILNALTGQDGSVFGTLSNALGDVLYEGVTWYAATEAAEAAERAGESKADTFFANADLYSAEAAQVRRRAQEQQVRMQYNGLRFMSSQRTNYLKAGVTLEGSPLVVIKETNDLIKTSISDMLQVAEDQASNLERQAAIQQQAAQNAKDDADFNAKQVLIGKAAQTAQNVLGIG